MALPERNGFTAQIISHRNINPPATAMTDSFLKCELMKATLNLSCGLSGIGLCAGGQNRWIAAMDSVFFGADQRQVTAARSKTEVNRNDQGGPCPGGGTGDSSREGGTANRAKRIAQPETDPITDGKTSA